VISNSKYTCTLTSQDFYQQLSELQKQAEKSASWADDIIVGIKMMWETKEWVKACLFLSAWVAIGTCYGMASSQRMSFLTALYFAVTSISTAGMHSGTVKTVCISYYTMLNNILT
jgi:hypothetical protein